MGRQNRHTEHGVTLIELLIALVLLAIALALIINTIIAFIRSPSSIDLVEVGRVGAAGGPVTITYRVNLNYDSARTTAVSENVDIEEVDFGPFQNDLLDLVVVSTAARPVNQRRHVVDARMRTELLPHHLSDRKARLVAPRTDPPTTGRV
jgi:prepilin-type N-terminal cleavage/methylation domain-containing protein